MTMPEKHYRYESVRYSVIVDAEREIFGVTPAKLECREYRTSAETPKGYWIGIFRNSKSHWVSKTSVKRFAFPTKAEALESYYQRKKAFVRHAKARLKRAEEDLRLAEREIGKPEQARMRVVAND